MGTRNLTMVVKDGEFKIAQYGQFDGYPSGSGFIVLNFLKTAKLDVFAEKLKNLRWLTDADCDVVNATENWKTVYPELSRNTGAMILEMVYESEKEMLLKDSKSFAGDSLFCEWAYLIDLDNNTLEVYRGFNKTPVIEGRFKSDDMTLELDDKGVYHPIKLVKTYSLSELPDESQFCEDLDPADNDE
jgi:hypothetical protein